MKFMFIGDLQSHNWKAYPETNEEGVNLRLMDMTHELNRLGKLCIEREIESVFILGDIFEARNALDIVVLNQVYRAFRTFSEAGIRVVPLVGNHDRTGVGNEHALEVFKPWCDVVDMPTTFPFSGGDVVAIPFHPNPKAISKAIKDTVTEDTKILLLHCAVRSLVMPSGKLWGEGISLEDIPKHVICLLGHYHQHKELRTGRVYYLGSMLQVDRSDMGTSKYYAVYDSTKKERPLRFFPTQGPKFVALDIERHTAGYYESIEHAVDGNFVTVKSLPNGWPDASAVVDMLYKTGARHVNLAVMTIDPIMPPQVDDTIALDAEAQVDEYVDQSDVPLDKQVLQALGHDIVRRAENPAGNTAEHGKDSDIDRAFEAMQREVDYSVQEV